MSSSKLAPAGSPQSFTDPAFFDAEREKLFRPAWICVAHTSQLKGPGDYLTADLFGAPVIIVRGEDGEIRTLSNVCLHRAMPIAEGSGNAGVFTCPYHLWAYDLDGRLKSAPLIGKDSGIDLSAYRLPCLKTEIWQGFVFVNRDRNAAPLGPQLAPLAEVLKPQGLSEMVHVGSMDYPSPWNWKVMVENFMEAYHHIGAHRHTLQPALPAIQSSMMDLDGPFAVLDMPPIEGEHTPLWAVCVYPNLLFALEPAAPAPYMTWYEMSNLAHDRFDLTVHVFFPEERAGDAGAVKGALELTNLVHQEDIIMCEGVQRGLQSPFAEQGPLAPGLEAPLAHFRAWIDRRLSA